MLVISLNHEDAILHLPDGREIRVTLVNIHRSKVGITAPGDIRVSRVRKRGGPPKSKENGKRE